MTMIMISDGDDAAVYAEKAALVTFLEAHVMWARGLHGDADAWTYLDGELDDAWTSIVDGLVTIPDEDAEDIEVEAMFTIDHDSGRWRFLPIE